MDLSQLREQIDTIDRQIAALLTQRMDLTNEVAAYKKANGLAVYHPGREQQVIEKICSLTKPEYQQALTVIYQCIMDESKKNQERQLQK